MKKKIAFLIEILIFLILLMKFLGPRESLDAFLYYSGNSARAFFDRLDDIQIAKYKVNECIDIIFIATYTLTTTFSLKALYRWNWKIRFASFSPGFFDLVETSSILYILFYGDNLSILNWLGIVTLLKWSLAILAVCMIGFGYFRPSPTGR